MELEKALGHESQVIMLYNSKSEEIRVRCKDVQKCDGVYCPQVNA